MFTKRELQDAIAECESKPSSYASCEKLAVFKALYQMYFADEEHIELVKSVKPEPISVQNEIQITSGSEFMQAVSGRDWAALLGILDELMDTIKVLQPRLYDAVMQKLKQ